MRGLMKLISKFTTFSPIACIAFTLIISFLFFGILAFLEEKFTGKKSDFFKSDDRPADDFFD